MAGLPTGHELELVYGSGLGTRVLGQWQTLSLLGAGTETKQVIWSKTAFIPNKNSQYTRNKMVLFKYYNEYLNQQCGLVHQRNIRYPVENTLQ